jgi:DNA processing protein
MAPKGGTHAVSSSERIDRIRLARSENVGPVTFRRLLAGCGSAAGALARLPELARRGGRPAVRIASRDQAEQELAALDKLGGRLIVWGDAGYPPHLAAIDDAPPLLAILGDPDALARPSVAIVGSRNASLNGRRLAETLAADIGRAGCVVVSGLARGIDAAAHRGALATGTVAVVAGGVDVIYPRENTDLYRRIAETGAVVSEIPPGVAPQARHFPRRNRIISGLSQAVVVVEANTRSGSLITARMALEQGRDVGAVPGSPLDGRARGCNDLIRHGAQLVENAGDVLGLVFGATGVPSAVNDAPHPADGLSENPDTAADIAFDLDADHHGDALNGETARDSVLTLLSPTPVSIDDVVRICHLPAAVVNTILLEWELGGRLERHPGNRIALAAPPSGA